jgi:hypothetical protein
VKSTLQMLRNYASCIHSTLKFRSQISDVGYIFVSLVRGIRKNYVALRSTTVSRVCILGLIKVSELLMS